MSGIVDRLEKRGMIYRMPGNLDKRTMCVRATPQVEAWMAEQLPALKLGPLAAALQRAHPDEREALAKAVTRLRRLLSRD